MTSPISHVRNLDTKADSIKDAFLHENRNSAELKLFMKTILASLTKEERIELLGLLLYDESDLKINTDNPELKNLLESFHWFITNWKTSIVRK